MCGRFTLNQSPEAIAEQFDLPDAPALPARYNIAPTQPIAVVRSAPDQAPSSRQFTVMQWGLIPSWSKDPQIGSRLINARAETIAEKPAFRSPFKRRRCLIITDGFYEWQRVQRKKQPFYFCLDQHQPFAFAGLWDYWERAEGAIESCTIITTEANDVLRPVHDRMPVILSAEDYSLWLDPTIQSGDRLLSLLHPYQGSNLISYPVSPAVNNPQHDSPDCIQPLVS